MKYVQLSLDKVMVAWNYGDSVGSSFSSKDRKISEQSLELYRKIFYARAVAFYRLKQRRNFIHDAELAVWLYGKDDFRYYLSKHLIESLSQEAQDHLIKLNEPPFTLLKDVDGGDKKKKLIFQKAASILERELDAILTSAFWDFGWRGKARQVLKIYRDKIRAFYPSIISDQEKSAGGEISDHNKKDEQIYLTDLLCGGMVQIDNSGDGGGVLRAAVDIKGGGKFWFVLVRSKII